MEPEFRYERKFFVEGTSARQVIRLLKHHPAMFREIYPLRYINNIYLDTPLVSDYYDNLGGASERRKTRIRWYHDLYRQVPDGILEFKIKRGVVGTKRQYSYPAFEFSDRFSWQVLREIARRDELPQEVRLQLAGLEPVMVNRYQRWYFATPDRRFRVTVDSGLTFYHLNKFSNHFLNKQVNYQDTVLELKYHKEDDPHADQIAAGFPFRVTRSSKYVQGIDKVYL